MYYILGSADADHSTAALVTGNPIYVLFDKYGATPYILGGRLKKMGRLAG
ncbi:hypothetical protein [Shouchella miscanthi]|uniref:Uncharacterized protein n=1 Tax=Shouchella miscanthi TaxID=2598861 RepID=A0ABU6NNC4_9BACI|nr:hypothetical protein [Shouchella miscanthi]MED4129451.1 hypothetical protein [Shouchella miscanthi]